MSADSPIRAHVASSYAQITHRGDFLCSTDPPDVILKLTPFPFSSLRPESSVVCPERIPVCQRCQGFFNKYCPVNRGSWRCSLCGCENEFRDRSFFRDTTTAEFRNEVIDAFCTTNRYKIRGKFVSTDFYIISWTVLQTKPYILDIIKNIYERCYQPKKVGIMILHGAVTVVNMEPRVSLLTFPDGKPSTDVSKMFIGNPQFCKSLEQLKDSLLSLKYIHGAPDDQTLNGLDFAFEAAKVYATSIRMILDEADFHKFGQEDSMRERASELIRMHAQVSLIAFADSAGYTSNLFDLPVITGGFMKFFSRTSTQQEISDSLVGYLNAYTVHDCIISVCAPNNLGIADYAGRGFQRSRRSFTAGKVEAGGTFYFMLNMSKVTHTFVQFVICFTTESDVRKLRIITLKISELPQQNPSIMTDSISALVSHRMLTESIESAKKYMALLRTKFKKFDDACFAPSEALFTDMPVFERARRCLTYMSGPYSARPVLEVIQNTSTHEEAEL